MPTILFKYRVWHDLWALSININGEIIIWQMETGIVKKSSNKNGARAIQTLGAQLWNELPLELRDVEKRGAFRKNL